MENFHQNFVEDSYYNLLSNEIKKNNVEAAKSLIAKVTSSADINRLTYISMKLERKGIFPHLLEKSNIDINKLDGHVCFLRQSLNCSDNYFLNELLNNNVCLEYEVYRMILHDAVTANKASFVEVLLKYGASVDNLDDVDMIDLVPAIENSNFDIVSLFLYYNCDVSSKNGSGSAFMHSMLYDSSLEIQLLLLEYESDINNSDSSISILFTAIKSCKHLISHILSHGGDVNQICMGMNIIELIFEHPIPPDIFKQIWEEFDYETWESTIAESILVVILNQSLPSYFWNEYLTIIIESSKLPSILDNQLPYLISLFVQEYTKRGFSELEFYNLICILLVNGCSVHAINLHQVYNLLGNTSIILKLLIHMDLERTHFINIDFNFIRVRYNFDSPVDLLLKNFLFNMKIFNMNSSFKDILRYFSVPPKVKEYLLDPSNVPCPFLITWDHVVPTLVELSRNKARDFICKKYNVRSGGRYCCIVKHLSLPEIVKNILTFERPLHFIA